MKNTVGKRVTNALVRARGGQAVQTINRILVSPWGLGAVGVLTLLAYLLAWEIVFYTLLVAIAIYVCVFGEDLLAIMPLVLFCYIVINPKNNPAKWGNTIFSSGAVGGYLATIFLLAFVCIVLRIVLDKDIGLKKFFTKKRKLLWGFLALGLAYVLSGIGSAKYFETFWYNLAFALLQFGSLFLVYFIFSATVKWEKVDKRYFFWAGLVMGLVVVGELLHIYCVNDVIVNGSIVRVAIYSGWGMYNNIGAMITVAIPCALYLAVEHKHGYIFIALSVALLLGVVLSSSRGSMVVAVGIFLAGNVLLGVTTKYKWNMLALAIILGVGALIGVCFFADELATMFQKVPSILQPSVGGDLVFNDSNRFEVYKEGWKSFLKYPVFGDSFYPSGYRPWQFGDMENITGVMNFYPPRWHNTVIQLLASCGIVGLLAYGFHRVQTVILVCKKRSVTTWFLVLSVGALLLMCLLDCHLFNIWPGFFYSTALVFLECLPHTAKDEKVVESKTVETEQTPTQE